MDNRALAVGVCVRRFREADHLASVVDALSKTVVATQGAEVRDRVASVLCGQLKRYRKCENYHRRNEDQFSRFHGASSAVVGWEPMGGYPASGRGACKRGAARLCGNGRFVPAVQHASEVSMAPDS